MALLFVALGHIIIQFIERLHLQLISPDSLKRTNQPICISIQSSTFVLLHVSHPLTEKRSDADLGYF
ncbi:hypothetical protein AN477_23085 [Alicyclobacillus ferrooxydans]|uniref:Uncharacterized protein n=1 Tax=Alicyclobacillus ferrooxydans TaxID=471514 RepID=A0A0P9CRT7_9BACL|nr:hypothetical protein AN477_23085 [Alicyclobacillus ferrooxydans]